MSRQSRNPGEVAGGTLILALVGACSIALAKSDVWRRQFASFLRHATLTSCFTFVAESLIHKFPPGAATALIAEPSVVAPCFHRAGSSWRWCSPIRIAIPFVLLSSMGIRRARDVTSTKKKLAHFRCSLSSVRLFLPVRQPFRPTTWVFPVMLIFFGRRNHSPTAGR